MAKSCRVVTGTGHPNPTKMCRGHLSCATCPPFSDPSSLAGSATRPGLTSDNRVTESQGKVYLVSAFERWHCRLEWEGTPFTGLGFGQFSTPSLEASDTTCAGAILRKLSAVRVVSLVCGEGFRGKEIPLRSLEVSDRANWDVGEEIS